METVSLIWMLSCFCELVAGLLLYEGVCFSFGRVVLSVRAVSITWMLICFRELVDDGVGCVALKGLLT